MTKNDLIEWLMSNLDCIKCPRYSYCQTAKPNSCSGVLRETPDVAQIALDCAERSIGLLKMRRRMYGHEYTQYFHSKMRELRQVKQTAKLLLKQGGSNGSKTQAQ